VNTYQEYGQGNAYGKKPVVPEPGLTGAILLGCCLLFLLFYRRNKK
jgi:hypothetical protein